ncbi:hypothetical protein IE980_05925 [Klebsiella pneumoniae]|uniref:Uncharacterized protein n=1 Tax=Klebsiella pneumoniae TaxID=573 RepID=A0A927HWG7_KLEPN|nr:hypothetical protein [Klebsiella pneumoniae]
MIITNNERWEIACSGSEPGGFQSIGGSRVGPAGDGKPGISTASTACRASATAFRWGEQDGINFDPLFTASAFRAGIFRPARISGGE